MIAACCSFANSVTGGAEKPVDGVNKFTMSVAPRTNSAQLVSVVDFEEATRPDRAVA